MPLGQNIPRSRSRSSVQTCAPVASGVHGSSNEREWMKRRPTGFVYKIRDRALRAGRQDRLTQEYEPVCNRQFGTSRSTRRIPRPTHE